MSNYLLTGRTNGILIMNKDPIVDEVREIRRKHAEKHNFDLRKIFEDYKSKEVKSNHPTVSHPPKKHLKATGS